MLIVCPTCSATYDIPAHSLGATGRTVRCASCKTVWFMPPEESEKIVAEHAHNKAPPVVNLAPEETKARNAAATDTKATARKTEKPVAAPPAAVRKTADTVEKTGNVIPLVTGDAEPAAGAKSGAEKAAPTLGAVDEKPDKARDRSGWFQRRRERKEQSVPRFSKPVAADEAARKTPLWMTACFCLCVVGLVTLVAKRDSVAAFLPETSHLYRAIGLNVNVRGLEFRDVKTSEGIQDGMPLLVIEGVIKNVTTHDVDIPRLRLAVRAEDGRELFAWTAIPAQSNLQKGAEVPFRAQLASPPLDGKNVVVRFITRQDSLLRN